MNKAKGQLFNHNGLSKVDATQRCGARKRTEKEERREEGKGKREEEERKGRKGEEKVKKEGNKEKMKKERRRKRAEEGKPSTGVVGHRYSY